MNIFFPKTPFFTSSDPQKHVKKQRIALWLDKKQRPQNLKTIRYLCRKKFADTRKRIGPFLFKMKKRRRGMHARPYYALFLSPLLLFFLVSVPSTPSSFLFPSLS